MATLLQNSSRGPAVLHYQYCYWSHIIHFTWVLLSQWLVIPLYQLVIVRIIPRIKNIQMLTKMWIGLYLSLLQVVLYIIVVVNHDTRYWLQRQVTVSYYTIDTYVYAGTHLTTWCLSYTISTKPLAVSSNFLRTYVRKFPTIHQVSLFPLAFAIAFVLGMTAEFVTNHSTTTN